MLPPVLLHQTKPWRIIGSRKLTLGEARRTRKLAITGLIATTCSYFKELYWIYMHLGCFNHFLLVMWWRSSTPGDGRRMSHLLRHALLNSVLMASWYCGNGFVVTAQVIGIMPLNGQILEDGIIWSVHSSFTLLILAFQVQGWNPPSNPSAGWTHIKIKTLKDWVRSRWQVCTSKENRRTM